LLDIHTDRAKRFFIALRKWGFFTFGDLKMNVKQLIELLSTHDENADVVVFVGDDFEMNIDANVIAVDAIDPENDTVTIFTTAK
jgi:hypothetical protein